MDLPARNESIAELRTNNQRLTWGVLAVSAAIMLLSFKLVMQSEILHIQTPGMPADAIIARDSFDKGAQLATLNAITNNLAALNPSNAEYQKKFLQLYFAPEAYTRLSTEMEMKVQKMLIERELGSSYFIVKRYEFDPALNKHFVIGEQHTVNAAKDTAEDYVFEYQIRIENYRLWVEDLKTYRGDRAHNSEWVKGNKK